MPWGVLLCGCGIVWCGMMLVVVWVWCMACRCNVWHGVVCARYVLWYVVCRVVWCGVPKALLPNCYGRNVLHMAN